MILIIDTSDANFARLSICRGEPCQNKEIPAPKNQLDKLLTTLEETLQSLGAKLRDIRAIAVNQGPGSYTGTRVGVTVANTLGWVFNIPVIGFSKGEPEEIARFARTHLQTHPHFEKPILPLYPENEK